MSCQFALPADGRIKESRLLVEFREQDSYLNSDYESDASEAAPELDNSLLTNARILARAAETAPRMPGLGAPRLRYVLTRLDSTGHADPRVTQTLAEMRRLGIQLEFGDWPVPPPRRIRPVQPGPDIILDLSILVALCCDSTHHPLPADEWALESRFRSLKVDGERLVLGEYTNATRDLRDQLRCEAARPLVHELMERLDGRPARFWVTAEVRDRLPQLVDVIGGEQEQYRARAMFGTDNFWAGSRWAGRVGPNLVDFRVGVLEDAHMEAEPPATPFDAAAAHVCRDMLRAADDSGAATPVAPEKEANGETSGTSKPKAKASKNPARARAGTRFSNAKLPSGHTLRTLLAGIERRMTVLTNNRGAVSKVLREQGVIEGIPFEFPSDGASDDAAEDGTEGTRARIWIVNPSSLAEWRRIQVERANTELVAQTGARIDRTL